jgi:hypothetical protein
VTLPLELGGITDPDVRHAFEQIALRFQTPQLAGGRVNADGTIAAGRGFSVVKTGTGDYTVTVGFAPTSVLVTQIGTGTGNFGMSGISGNSFHVVGTADAPFSFMAWAAG